MASGNGNGNGNGNGHSELPPSGAERWMTCPGSVVLSDGMPESESEYAAEGTHAHAFAERWLLMHFAQHGDNPFVGGPDEEIAKNVKVYVDECIGLVTKTSKVYIEKKVAINESVYGTADFICWRPETATLYVRDLKYGSGVPVSVERNIQLRIYALATLITMKLPASVVSIGIVQPRYEHPDGFIRVVDFDVVDLLDLHADVDEAVARSEEAKAAAGPNLSKINKAWEEKYLKPSEKGCRWCLASPKCPALKNKAQALAKQVFAEPTILPPANAPDKALAKPAYNPLELARALDFMPILEAWIKNTREFAYSEAEKGIEIPDYKLVEKQAVRKFKEDTNRETLAKTFGVTVAEILKPAELLGVGDMEKLAPGKNAKERAAVLEPFVERKSSGHTLVHNSDKRDPVRIDAKAAFGEVTLAGILE